MQTKISKISNTLLKYFVIFSISYIWLNYLRIQNAKCFLYSTVISIIVGYTIKLINGKKNKRINLSKEQQLKIENTTLQFMYSPLSKTLDFLNHVFKDSYAIKKHKTWLQLDSLALFPMYFNNNLTENEVLKAIKETDLEIVIFCANYSDIALKTATHTNRTVHILNQSDVFNILCKYNTFPQFGITKQIKQKPKLSDIKNNAFARKNAKNYLLSSLLIFVSSFFVRFNIYYSIISTILLCFAFISLFKPKPQISTFSL